MREVLVTPSHLIHVYWWFLSLSQNYASLFPPSYLDLSLFHCIIFLSFFFCNFFFSCHIFTFHEYRFCYLLGVMFNVYISSTQDDQSLSSRYLDENCVNTSGQDEYDELQSLCSLKIWSLIIWPSPQTGSCTGCLKVSRQPNLPLVPRLWWLNKRMFVLMVLSLQLTQPTRDTNCPCAPIGRCHNLCSPWFIQQMSYFICVDPKGQVRFFIVIFTCWIQRVEKIVGRVCKVCLYMLCMDCFDSVAQLRQSFNMR